MVSAIYLAAKAPKVLCGLGTLSLATVLSVNLRDQVFALIPQADRKVRQCAIDNIRRALVEHLEAHRRDAARRYAIEGSQRPAYFGRQVIV